MLARYLQLYRHEHQFTHKTEEPDMCNPYDNNPFRNDDRRDFTNEHDANRALANTVNRQSEKPKLNCGACTVAIGAHHRREGCRYYEGK